MSYPVQNKAGAPNDARRWRGNAWQRWRSWFEQRGSFYGFGVQRGVSRRYAFFLRMAGHYAETIFLDTRVKWSGNRSKAYKNCLDELIKSDPKCKQFMTTMWKQQPGMEFAFKASFTVLLNNLNTSCKDNLTRRLQWEHALPWGADAYIKAIAALRQYRHFLAHYDDYITESKERPALVDILKLLGLLLLPHLHNHLVGRVIHHERKLGICKAQLSQKVRGILQGAEADRREASRNLFGLKTRQMLPRNERQDRVAYNDRWKARFPLWFADDTWPRYNEHNFKVRYHFIGAQHLEILGTVLQGEGDTAKAGYFADPARSDFIREIEALYYAALDINLIMHKWLTEIEVSGVNLEDKFLHAAIKPLRNEIAHGGLFWQVQDKSRNARFPLETIFSALLDLPKVAGKNAVRQCQNGLVTAITAVIKQYAGHRVHDRNAVCDDPNRLPPPIVVHRWTAQKRVRYANRDHYRIDRRPRLRATLAVWKRALNAAELKKN